MGRSPQQPWLPLSGNGRERLGGEESRNRGEARAGWLPHSIQSGDCTAALGRSGGGDSGLAPSDRSPQQRCAGSVTSRRAGPARKSRSLILLKNCRPPTSSQDRLQLLTLLRIEKFAIVWL